MDSVKVEVVIKTTTMITYPKFQTITRYWDINGNLLFEKISGEKQHSISENELPSIIR